MQPQIINFSPHVFIFFISSGNVFAERSSRRLRFAESCMANWIYTLMKKFRMRVTHIPSLFIKRDQTNAILKLFIKTCTNFTPTVEGHPPGKRLFLLAQKVFLPLSPEGHEGSQRGKKEVSEPSGRTPPRKRELFSRVNVFSNHCFIKSKDISLVTTYSPGGRRNPVSVFFIKRKED